MEYIQCTHCHKKYRVNDKVRAAEGRMVACKDCQQPIEIIIQHDEPEAQEQAQTIPEPQKRRNISKRKPPKKVSHTGMRWLSISLGILLITASIYIFFQGRSEQANALHSTPKVSQPAKPSNPTTATIAHPKNCKQAAAQQWFSDFAMAHGQQQGTEYMQLLNQSIQSSALVRQYCQHTQVVAEILSAAQQGTPPTWLQPTLAKLTQQETISQSQPHF